MASTKAELGKTDKMTNEQLLINVKELLDRYRVVDIDSIAMDIGTWDRLTKVTDLIGKGYYTTSMSGDNFLFGKRVLFAKRAGVQLLFKGPAQSLLEL